MPNVAEILAAGLRRHEVDALFGQSLPSLLILAAERAGVRQVVYRTENAGGAMADGFARASGRVGVVAAQNGPAAALLVAPLAEALKASVPVVALVQDVPRPARERNAFQELDHHALFAACAKWVGRLDDPAQADRFLDLAFRHAVTGRPGPAVLLLPKDVLAEEAVADAGRRQSLGRFPLDRTRPDAAAVRAAARLLAEAADPLVIAGGGVHLSGAAQALAALQEEASLPVATTTMGKGAVDEEHPLSLGVAGAFMGARSLTRGVRPLIAEADVVLLVGSRTNENGTDGWRLLPEGATYLHLDVDGAEIGRNHEALRLAGDARLGLEDLLAELTTLDLSRRRERRGPLAARIAEAYARDRAAAAELTAADAAPIRPERLMAELDPLLSAETIVVADASFASIWSPAYLRSRAAGQRFLSPRGLAGLGWGFPMALGAKAANPDADVVCIAGDGGFAHCWQELETAVRERLPVTTIVLDNAVLAYQKQAELHAYGAHTTAVGIGPIDHVAIARACGAEATRVERPDQLAAALAAALASARPALIEVAVDPGALPPLTAWD